MPADEAFAERLKQALLIAQAAHDAKVGGRARGKRGQFGLEQLSISLAQKRSLRPKPGTSKLKARVPRLHREKLARLIEGDLTTPLTVQELTLLDLVLQESGNGGLVSLLRPRNWVDSLVVTGNVLFVVGSQTHNYLGREGDFIVAYDLRAITNLLRDFDRRAAFPIDPDLLYSTVGSHTDEEVLAKIGLGRLLPTAQLPTVFIGSPVTNPMTELACCEALGFEPWSPTSSFKPFWFAWPDGIGCRSTFTNRARAKELLGSRRAFAFDKDEFSVDRDRGTTHGIVVLGSIPRPVVVIMGVTAAATYACSLVAASISHEFPEEGTALVAHVQAESDIDASRPGADKRIVTDPKVVSVRLWSKLATAWVK